LALEHLVSEFILDLSTREEKAKEKGIVAAVDPGSFFSGLGLHRSYVWAKDFKKRLEDARNNQTEQELELDEKDIIDSGWKGALSI
jgi:hypothetical protein